MIRPLTDHKLNLLELPNFLFENFQGVSEKIWKTEEGVKLTPLVFPGLIPVIYSDQTNDHIIHCETAAATLAAATVATTAAAAVGIPLESLAPCPLPHSKGEGRDNDDS